MIAPIKTGKVKLSKEQFNAIMKEHAVWQYDDDKGKRAEFCAVDLTECDLTKRNLDHCIFKDCNLNSVDFTGSSLRFTRLVSCNLRSIEASKVDFSQSNFTFCDLTGSTCRGACFLGNTFAKVIFSHSILSSANFQGSHFKNSDFVETICIGTDFSSSGFQGCNLLSSALRGSSFHSSTLSHSCLSESRLSLVDFRYSRLSNCNLSFCSLWKSDVSDACFTCCNFHGITIKDSPIAILNAGYFQVVFLKDHLIIGCKRNTYRDWLEVDEAEAKLLDRHEGRDFLRSWREPLIQIRKALNSKLGEVTGGLQIDPTNPMNNYIPTEGAA